MLRLVRPQRNLLAPCRLQVQRLVHVSAKEPTTPVRVRFAPSPTGNLHLGGLRTALLNYLLARKTNGTMILRIEDTDRNRLVPGSVDMLVNALQWAGINYEEGPSKGGPHAPYSQSERTEIYRSHADQLLENGSAYRCFCSQERLKSVRERSAKAGKPMAYDRHCLSLSKEEVDENLKANKPFTIRLNTPEGTTVVHDQVYGKVEFNNRTIDDAVLMKSDGFPTYHLANVIDDHLMDITHVLRGEEWLPSTPKHLILYKSFGWTAPHFVHLPLLLNADKSKLSKRSGDVHLEDYMRRGYLPEAVMNFVALLGWHPNTDQEIFDSNELIEAFSLSQLNNSNAIVTLDKLDWINKQHLLRRASTSTGMQSLVDMLQPIVNTTFGERLVDNRMEYRMKPEYLTGVISTIKDRIRNIQDITNLCSYFFVEPDWKSQEAELFHKKLNKQALTATLSTEYLNGLSKLGDFTAKIIKEYIHKFADQRQLKANQVMMATRYAITATKVGAGVAETMEVLGRDTCLNRLQLHIES
ncbi:Glutamate--tRNA ligase mitochondrial [Umbelopsis sp. WA50703]